MISTDQVHPIIKMVEEVGFSPRGIQRKAIEYGLLDGKSVLVCAPTGAGKTLIGEMALLRAIEAGRRGLYLVPLRALANQVYSILKERYERQRITVGISTSDYYSTGELLS